MKAMLKAEALSAIPWVRHGFFSRQGGTSTGIYASLNCGPGSSDDPAHVAANRAQVAEAIEAQHVLTLNQVHSAIAITVEKPWAGERPSADGMVTMTPGLGLGALAADCAPVLFASKKDRIVAATHSGWRGAISGVLEATVEEMKKCGAKPSDIVAVIGPCIGPASYEVGGDFDKPFLKQDMGNAKFFRPAERTGHLMFNLPGYVAHMLKAAGVGEVHDLARDTLPDEKNYFSYRRTTLRKEPDYGRQISAIAIK